MKLIVGKSYLDRTGNVWKVNEISSQSNRWFCTSKEQTTSFHHYDGSFRGDNRLDSWDLVEEIVVSV